MIQAHVYYLIATFVVLGLAWRRGGVSFECAVALLIWYCLANAAYQYGEVETTATLVVGSIQVALCGILVRRHDHHWLTLYLLVSATAVILWTAFYSQDPYAYKAVKNGIYLSELLAVSASLWISPRTS